MYQVTCDDFPLLDVRTDEYILVSPKIKVEVNKVGGGSFTIHKNHPNYNTIQLMKSVIEVKDEIGVIFRGRATENTRDFNNGKAVDLEGVMGYFNDSIVRPFNFPQDFVSDAGYISASASGNVVEFFLKWLIDNHNSQVQEFQKLKLGVVTVSDPNNYITRSDSAYKKTWEIIKSKLFESSLGGYICIRYEDDGNYIDYVSKFELANTQPIEFGKNLLDIKSKSSASATYTAIIPIGAEIEEEIDGEIIKSKLDITTKADGVVSPGVIKKGDMLYSEEAVNRFGWIVAPVSDTTWDDVTTVENLVKNGVTWLTTQGAATANSIDISAVDLHFSDAEIQSFRIYRNVLVSSMPHNHNTVYQLTKLDIDLLNPQNTKITVGASRLSLVNASNKALEHAANSMAITQKAINESKAEVTGLRAQMTEENTKIIATCNEIILSALENYVETTNYSEFKETVETQLKILSDQILLNFTTTTEEINNVDGDLQSKFTELYKYISFSSDGIVIGDGETGLTLSIDNDMISFKKGGQQFGWWDGTDFHTGNIIVDVDERAQFGNFAFVPRSDGSLMFLKVR